MHDIKHDLRGSIKAIKQESHGAPVSAMQFNDVDPECSNLFATVGADQVSLLVSAGVISTCAFSS